jgi:hypothetical protein
VEKFGRLARILQDTSKFNLYQVNNGSYWNII